MAISISSLHAYAGPWAYHGLAIKAPQSLSTTEDFPHLFIYLFIELEYYYVDMAGLVITM